MKRSLVVASVCVAVAALAAVAVIVAAGQNRGFDGGGPGSRLASALDADRDGVISGAEISASSGALKALDGNGDGRLTGDELRPAFGPGGPRGDGGRRGRGGDNEGAGGSPAASADDLAETLMAFDRNSDGKLDRAEVPERYQGLFDRGDANKDGALTRDELKQSASASVAAEPGRDGGPGRRGGGEGAGFGRGRGGPPADPLMRALDADGDGAVSEQEMAHASDAIRTLDANHDGQLSSDEYRPAPGRGGDGRDGRRR
jgi:Ca2+-binding EF-hand superfamily protein